MIICCDIDNTLNNCTETALKRANALFGTNISMDEFTAYNFYDCLDESDARKVMQIFRDYNFWLELDPLPDAVTGIKSLMNAGHRVVFATAAHHDTFQCRVVWMNRYFPFVDSGNIIRIVNKSLLNCDIMIDDYMDQLSNNLCERICIDYPWNRNKIADIAYDIHRAFNWKDVVNIINKIGSEIN